MKAKLNGFLTLFLAFLVQISFAQEKTIKGKVSDATGGLPSVSVLIKGTKSGTETDFDGNYSIKAKVGDILQFSYLGYVTAERKVGKADIINVTLVENSNVLQEVVITTALGIKRNPKELSYSQQTLKNDEVTKTKSVNVATAMVGKVAGLQINTVNNGVSPSTRVVLRGNRSLLGNNQALIVVDGYPSSRGVLDRISPDDIENITVLKGANASSLYGSDAANGVLVITTKKGEGKLTITYSNTLQFESVAYLPELQTEFGVGGFPDGTLWPLENVNWGPRYDGRLVDASETLDNGEVWQVPFTPIKNRNENFFDTGITKRNSISISRGNEMNQFRMSFDHTDVTGIVPKDEYERVNFRLNASTSIDNFSIGGNFSFYNSNYNTVGTGRQGRPLYWQILNTPLHIPLDQMKNWRDGKFTRNEVSFFRFYENPYWVIDTQRNIGGYNEYNFVTDLKYDFNDWINITFKTGYTSSTSTSKSEKEGFNYAFHLQHVYSEIDPSNPSTSDALSTNSRFNTDLILSINKKITDDLKVNFIAGQNTFQEKSKSINVGGSNLIVPEFYNVSTRTGELQGGESSSKRAKIGVYSELTLGYKEYLFLTVSGRNDWTSTLNTDRNSFFYPGGGISFIVSDAIPSIKSDNGLSYLKTNFNITSTGNEPGAYAISNVFSRAGGFPFGSTAGLSQSSRISDLDLKPEFTTSLEAGLEFGLFNNRLTTNIAAYKTNTTDQIVPVNISLASGASSLLTNIGEVENIGLEIEFNSTIIRNENFKWDLGMNYHGYKSKVISLKEGVDELDIGGFAAAQVIAKVGESFPLLRTTDYLRDNQGRVIVGDNGDPLRNPKNTIQGKTTPDYQLGLNTTFTYKNLSLYAVMDYRTGHVFYNGLVDALEFTGLTKHSVSTGREAFVFPNSVYANAQGEYIPNTNRLTTGGGRIFWRNFNDIKSNYVTDATTLKLREVLLNYNFSKETIKKFGLDNLSFGLFGRNLLTLRPKENVYTDPEFNFTTGNAVGVGTQDQTPPTRQYGLTLTVKF